jgi:hypothetical protein
VASKDETSSLETKRMDDGAMLAWKRLVVTLG